MTQRQITLLNGFEGGTAGVSVTATNSGPPSGSAFDTVQLNSGGNNILAYDNSIPAAHGSLSCKVAAPNTQNFVSWSSSMGTQTQIWFRLYLYFSSIPAFNVSFFKALQGNTVAATARVNATTGTLTVAPHGGSSITTTTVIPTNAWFRVEGFVIGDPSNGQVSISIYTALDSTVVTEIQTSGNVNTSGLLTTWNYGNVVAPGTGNNAQFWMDDIGLSNSGYIGPTPVGFTCVRADNGGCTTNVAVPLSARGTVGRVGCSVPNMSFQTGHTPPYYNAGLTQNQGDNNFTGFVSRSLNGNGHLAATKKFWNVGDYTTNQSVPAGNNLANYVTYGTRVIVCLQPTFTTGLSAGSTSAGFTSEYNASNNTGQLPNFLQFLVGLGFTAETCRIVLWQEPGNADKGVSATDYANMLRFYGPAVNDSRNGPAGGPFPLIINVNYAGLLTNATNYANAALGVTGPSTGCTFFGVAMDYYTNSYFGGHNFRLDSQDNNGYSISGIANTAGLPFGLHEFGCVPTQIDPGGPPYPNCTTYMQYVLSFMSGRLNQGLSNLDCIYYNGQGPPDGTGDITSPIGQDTSVVPGGAGDFRVPLYQQIFDALSTAGPSLGSSFCVGGDVEGFFTSSDGGDTWTTANTGIYNQASRFCATVQWSITEENTIYACVGNNTSNTAVSSSGFLVSANGGASWSFRNNQIQFAANSSGITGDNSRSTGNVLAQVAGQDLMYVATYNQGVYRSKGTTASPNHGHIWTNIGLGTLPGGANGLGRCIAVDPTNPNNLYVGMYNSGIWNATNASTAGTANWGTTPMTNSPAFPEQFVILTSGNIYVAAGSQGLWTTTTSGSGSGNWSQISSGGFLSASSYWMSIDGYTDNSGNDQLIIGCNNPVKPAGHSYVNYVWATITPSGGATFKYITDHVNVTTVGPENRTWWNSGAGEVLGKAGMIQVRPWIDKSTINTSNVTIYSAGSSGFWVSTGNNITSTGPSNAVTWSISCDGMPLHIGHEIVVNANNPNHFIWCTSDWCHFDVTDGTAYNRTTTTQNAPPAESPPAGQHITEGYSASFDPLSETTSNSHGTVYLSTGAKYHNDTGQIWARAGDAFSWTNISAAGTSNPGASGGNVAYGLLGGRQGTSPFLLAIIEGTSGTAGSGGMYRYSGYSISADGTINKTGGTWVRVSSAIGTSGNGSQTDIPNGPRDPIIADPNNAGVYYCFDQNAGIFRSTNYGQAWSHIWTIVANDTRTGFIACNPAVSGELWVSYWTSNATPGGLFKISNANTISSVNVGTNTSKITGIAFPGAVCFAPNGDVYCLSLPGSSPLSPNTMLVSSQDGGNTWFQADDGSLAAICSYPTNMAYASNGRIYVGSDANVVGYGYPVQPIDSGQVSMFVEPVLTAQGEDITSPTKTAFANLFIKPTMTVTPSSIQRVQFLPMQVEVSLVTGSTVFLVQQISGTSIFDYGMSTVEMNITAGNTLVVLAGWDLSTSTSSALMPAAYVTDSAGNYWYHVATTDPDNTGSRSSAWICPNASPISWLTVSLTTFASSLAYKVLELAGMPNIYSLDIADAQSKSSSSVLSLSPGRTSDNDFAFAIFTAGGFVASPTGTGSWVELNALTSDSSLSDINPATIFTYYQIPAQNASLNTQFTINQDLPVSAIIFSVHSTVASPLQANPNLPVLKIEAAFGSTPGDPSQAAPAWTDITNRCISGDGSAFVSVTMGRQFELAVVEAGEIQIAIDNHDGAFTPGNVNSPYYPNVLLGTPVRISAFWADTWYHIGYGYVERWPQEWPDLPQWGISKVIATDAISVLAAVTMSDALDSEMLLDVPYVLLPASEQYTTFTNGINSFFNAADPQGLLAQNISRVNQRPGVYVDGFASGIGIIPGNTGATTQMLGTANTGFGTDFFTTPPTGPMTGPGITYTDVNIPDPVSANGVTVCFWLIISGNAVSVNLEPVVFRAFGAPSNYLNSKSSFTVQVNNQQGMNTLTVTLADNTPIIASFNVSPIAQFVAITINSSSISIYINSALTTTASISPGQVGIWSGVSLGCPNYAYQAGTSTPGNFTAFSLGIYPYMLPVQRIVSQYNTGLFGQQNVDATERIAQLLSWANLGIPRAGRQTFNGIPDGVLQGPAYNLQGANVSDAVNQIALNHNAMVAAMPSGALVYFHKWALFDQEPMAVFGDNIDPTQGEIPSSQQTSWGYDNTYVYNVISVTQQYGANNQLTVIVADFTSESQYFTRSALTETITTMSNLDVYSLANWQINKYSQPSFRLSQLTIDAASNPEEAFPTVLALQQGDVVTVVRRPVGGAVITQDVIIQQISHSIGPGMWQTSYQMSPYTPENAVLQLDVTPFNALGSNTLP